MKFAVLAILAAGMSVQATAQDVCHPGRMEREEKRGFMEDVWYVYQKMNCSRENIDAATTLPDGYTYFFKDDLYWRMLDNSVDNPRGYPRDISEDWDTLPGDLDAALTWIDNRTFFFKGHEYWSFHGKKMDSGYPRNISEGFCGIPNNLDAAVLWKNDNSAYFFKGNQYWRFVNGDFCTPVAKDYPKPISGWIGIPADVDAAVQLRNGPTYFFKGGDYYRYDVTGINIGAGRATKVKIWGLRCSELNCQTP